MQVFNVQLDQYCLKLFGTKSFNKKVGQLSVSGNIRWKEALVHDLIPNKMTVYFNVLLLLIFFEPKHAQIKEKNREGKQNEIEEKEEAICSKKEGAPPPITLNLRSFFAGTVVTIGKNSSLARVEVGHSFLEERPKLQFRTVMVLIPERNKNRISNFKRGPAEELFEFRSILSYENPARDGVFIWSTLGITFLDDVRRSLQS
ncbi:uncharacterized protein DS421_17g578800 [Arachis hypogaea]|nr:uncharacterized protein DS421_17g578800 [Arachis hypogaea]